MMMSMYVAWIHCRIRVRISHEAGLFFHFGFQDSVGSHFYSPLIYSIQRPIFLLVKPDSHSYSNYISIVKLKLLTCKLARNFLKIVLYIKKKAKKEKKLKDDAINGKLLIFGVKREFL